MSHTERQDEPAVIADMGSNVTVMTLLRLKMQMVSTT